MFDEQEIIEFFNRIINAPNISNEEIQLNVTKFYEYLVLTKMCDEESLNKLSKIVTCLNELIKIKKTMGYIDISTLLQEPEKPKKLVKKPQNKKHYGHYETGGPSFCGSSSSSSYSSSCGTSSSSLSYSSSCGSSASYSSHC